MKSSLYFVLIGVGVFLFLGCSSDTSNGNNTPDISSDIVINTDASGGDISDTSLNMDAGKRCSKSSDCSLGNICIDGSCIEGCRVNDDCPPENHPARKLCNVNLGEHGRCVECLKNNDCESMLCDENGICGEPPACADDRDCIDVSKPYCDKSDGRCYECTDGTHCKSGTCRDHICDPFTGCEKDDDCKETNAPHCDLTDNRCYECVSGKDCLSNKCTDHRCDPLPPCNSNLDCPDLLPFCDPSDDRCYECVQSNQCVSGVCIDHKCNTSVDCGKDGCGENEQCDSFTGKCFPNCSSQDIQGYTIYYCKPPYPILGCDDVKKVCYPCTKNDDCKGRICDTTYHECVYCYSDKECAPSVCKEEDGLCVECILNTDCKDPTRPLCKVDNNICVQCLGDSDCSPNTPHCNSRNVCKECTTDAHCSNDMKCDPFYEECVECLRDADCNNSNMKCDPLYHRCVDKNIKAQCDECVSDSECGSGNYCVANKDILGGSVLERVCAWGCGSDDDCPKGYYCIMKDRVSGGKENVCFPDYAKIANILLVQVSTCKGVKDIYKMGCNNQSDTCGLTNAKDSVCIDIQQYNVSVCEIPCTKDNDCPDVKLYGYPVPTKCSEIPNLPLVKFCMPTSF